jgi:hypothetical protein
MSEESQQTDKEFMDEVKKRRELSIGEKIYVNTVALKIGKIVMNAIKEQQEEDKKRKKIYYKQCNAP